MQALLIMLNLLRPVCEADVLLHTMMGFCVHL